MLASTIPTLDPSIRRQRLDPPQVHALEPRVASSLSPSLWVYRYEHATAGWLLSIATHAAPGSGQLSLGGFRIAPESRTSRADYDNDREAIGLAVGMEAKVYWSRVLGVAGPLGRAHLASIVGGKCVLRPTANARVGQPDDRALLDFAAACLRDCEATGGLHVTTGQDLGHGTMSDGTTTSLGYLHDAFDGCVLADTSKPTGEGNFHLLRGMLAACDIPLAAARVGIVGAGNIGRHIVGRLREHGAHVAALELSADVRAALDAQGVEAWPVERKLEFLAQPFDAIVVNAAGGSLDAPAITVLCANPTVRVVCGSENLAMPDASGTRTLLSAGKIYAPTELGGMMGYLTAVEEYLARRAGVPFALETLFTAAERLGPIAESATRRVVASGYAESFEDAARAISRP